MAPSRSEVPGPAPPLGDLGRRTFVELLGAFALVFAGAGTIMSIGPQADAGTLDVALATGLAVAVMVTAVGHISGGHFNPAITLQFLLTRRIGVVLGLAYIVAQLLGGVLGSAAAPLDLPGGQSQRVEPRGAKRAHDRHRRGARRRSPDHVLSHLGRLRDDDRRANAYTGISGLAIGLVIVFGMLLAYPITGGSFNPARAFGPELVSGTWNDAWIYYVGPLAGGAIAALLYDEVYLRPAAPAPVGSADTGVEQPGLGKPPSDT